MKIVKYEVAGHLNQLETGPEAQVGDQVKLFLDQEGRPELPEFIFAIIQPPIRRIKCEEYTEYSFEYDETDIDSGLIRPDDIISVEVVAAVDVVANDLLEETNRAIAAETVLQENIDTEEARALAAEALLAPKASPTFTGDPKAPTPATSDNDTSVATTAFVKAQPYVRYDLQTLSVPERIQAQTNIGVANIDYLLGRTLDLDGFGTINWLISALTVTDNPVLTWASGDLVVEDAVDFSVGSTTGSKIGTATAQKLAFHNSTPVIQRASAAQTAVVTTASTQTTPWGFSTQAQADGIITLVNEIRAALVEKGLIKGSA